MTDELHTEIVAACYALLRRAELLHRQLNQLVLDGAGISAVLSAVAETLRAPIFLERSGGSLRTPRLPATTSIRFWFGRHRQPAPSAQRPSSRQRCSLASAGTGM